MVHSTLRIEVSGSCALLDDSSRTHARNHNEAAAKLNVKILVQKLVKNAPKTPF
jgi:hypothetical protein